MTDDLHGDYDEFPADAPWLRCDLDTDRSFHAFCIYRDAGSKRSLVETARLHYGLTERPDQKSGKYRQVKAWAAKGNWTERARAYSAHMDRMTLIDAREAVRDMNRRHAAIAAAATSKATQRIREIDASLLSVRESVELLKVGTTLERLARGQATEIIDNVDPIVAADRAVRDLMRDPRLAVAARDIAEALAADRAGKARDDDDADDG